MKTMRATLATVSLTMAEPGQAVSRNRAQLDFVIPDPVERMLIFSSASLLNFIIGIFIILLLWIWQWSIVSLISTVNLNGICYDLPVNIYASLITTGVILWVCLDESGAALIRLLLR